MDGGSTLDALAKIVLGKGTSKARYDIPVNMKAFQSLQEGGGDFGTATAQQGHDVIFLFVCWHKNEEPITACTTRRGSSPWRHLSWSSFSFFHFVERITSHLKKGEI
jgi:hypothetical protein